jgi:hypothetical protein
MDWMMRLARYRTSGLAAKSRANIDVRSNRIGFPPLVLK